MTVENGYSNVMSDEGDGIHTVGLGVVAILLILIKYTNKANTRHATLTLLSAHQSPRLYSKYM